MATSVNYCTTHSASTCKPRAVRRRVPFPDRTGTDSLPVPPGSRPARALRQSEKHLRGWQCRLLGRLFSDNLVASEGAVWLRQRRLAQGAFSRQRLAGYANVMVDATTQLLSRWGADAAAGKAVEIGPEMSRLALAIASRTLFDRDVSQEADSVGKASTVVAHSLEARFNHPFTSLPSWVPTATNRRFKQAVTASRRTRSRRFAIDVDAGPRRGVRGVHD